MQYTVRYNVVLISCTMLEPLGPNEVTDTSMLIENLATEDTDNGKIKYH